MTHSIVQIDQYGMRGKLSNSDNNNFFNAWAIFTGILQMMDYDLNMKQISNDVLLQHLQRQDKVLEGHSQELQKQTNEYLKKIVEQNEEILKILYKDK